MPERIHSSETQVFVDGQRIPAIQSVSINSEKKVTDIPRLGDSHVTERMLNANQTSTVSMDVFLTTGATGIDPIYSYQHMQSGFLSTGKFKFEVKDLAGVTTISGGSLTSYSINGTVDDIVKGSTTYVGDGAIQTSAGALTRSDASTDSFLGVFRPRNIAVSTTTDGAEGVDSTVLNIQSFDISTSIDKQAVTRLGERVPKFRYPSLPAQGNLNFEVVKTEATGIDISSLICETGVIKIDLKNDDGDSVLDFTTSGCCLESVNETTSLDDNTLVSFSYYFPILK
tara:strand:+ start:162 stop:1013 length:852 start_codon:yes stop_codon:yes gene_type:complete